MLCFVSHYHVLRNFKILYFWTDLAKIWLRAQTLAADSETEVVFYIRGQYQANNGHFCSLASKKHSLIIGLLLQQLKSQINKTYIVQMLHT